MGYRDDFYVAANIVGYKGNLHESPTVFFESAGGERGHIIQQDSQASNIGRARIFDGSSDYTGTDGSRVQLTDKDGGKDQKGLPDRSTMIDVNIKGKDKNDETSVTQATAILAQAIWKFMEIKPLHVLGRR